MKTLKAIGQVLSSLVYTYVYTWLMYLILIFPLTWILSLNTKIMILVLILFGGIIQALIMLAQTFVMLPYAWIVKNNKAALYLSIALILILFIRWDVNIWQNMLGLGTSAIVVAVIATVFIIEAIIMSIVGLVGMNEDK